MREKNGLDRNAFSNSFFNEQKELKDKKKMHQKISKFINNAPKCENFCWKKGEIHSKIYWCKKIDKVCIFANCPKNNNKSVND